SQPHNGHSAIERFYDTFIAPNGIRFQVDQDIVCGWTVMRDLTIETTMSTGVKLQVPMHLRYDLVEQNGALKIRRLYAHWELLPMILQLLGTGPRGWWTAVKLGPQLIAHQGLGGVLGFMRGFAGVGAAGKRAAEAFLAALSRGDGQAASKGLAENCSFELPAGGNVSLAELAPSLHRVHWRKLIAAGRHVTATITLGAGASGVVSFQFNDHSRINAVRIFVANPGQLPACGERIEVRTDSQWWRESSRLKT
ncbi:MAG: hypothetical protein ACREB3_16040, partial [Burkholderiales bacterium]